MGHIIVTGAGSGLGRALTIGLVERGHQVSMMGRRYQKLQEQEELLGKAVIGIAADLAHHEEVDVAFAAAVEWGGLPDMVIHCAGVGEFGPVGVYTAEQIRRVVESNLISTILVAQQTVRLIGDKGGGAGECAPPPPRPARPTRASIAPPNGACAAFSNPCGPS